MSKIVNALERSLAHAHSSESIANRRRDIAIMSNPIKRAGSLALHSLATRHPNITATVINRRLSGGYQYVGAGWVSVVLTNDHKTVVKVDLSSLTMTEEERQELAFRQLQEHNLLRTYLPDVVIKQSVRVDDHPAIKNKRAVLIRQRLVRFSDPLLFPPIGTHINEKALGALCDKVPHIRGQLQGFAQAGKRLYEHEGLIPDVLGQSNTVVEADANQNLIVIDGQPLSAELPRLQQLAYAQLTELEEMLCKAA